MKLAVLGSTNGTDLVPIVTAIKSGELLASIEVIVSNNESSGILRKARDYGIENHFICHKNKKRGVFDFEICWLFVLNEKKNCNLRFDWIHRQTNT